MRDRRMRHRRGFEKVESRSGRVGSHCSILFKFIIEAADKKGRMENSKSFIFLVLCNNQISYEGTSTHVVRAYLSVEQAKEHAELAQSWYNAHQRDKDREKVNPFHPPFRLKDYYDYVDFEVEEVELGVHLPLDMIESAMQIMGDK